MELCCRLHAFPRFSRGEGEGEGVERGNSGHKGVGIGGSGREVKQSGEKYQLMPKSRLRDGTEPANFVPKLLSNMTYP